MTLKTSFVLIGCLTAQLCLISQEHQVIQKNYIHNGSFEQGLKGYKYKKNNTPPPVSVSKDIATNGQHSLRLDVSSTTSSNGTVTKWLNVNALKPVKCLKLKARILIKSQATRSPKTGGALSLRLRQWKNNKFLRDALKIYCPFNEERVRIIEKKGAKTYPKVIRNYKDQWLEVESISPVDQDAEALDLLCNLRTNPGQQAVVYVDELSLEKFVQPIIKILKIAKAVKQGSTTMPIKVNITLPEKQKFFIKFTAAKKDKQIFSSKIFNLINGIQTLTLPISDISEGQNILTFKILDANGHEKQLIRKEVDCINDPFAE